MWTIPFKLTEWHFWISIWFHYSKALKNTQSNRHPQRQNDTKTDIATYNCGPVYCIFVTMNERQHNNIYAYDLMKPEFFENSKIILDKITHVGYMFRVVLLTQQLF